MCFVVQDWIFHLLPRVLGFDEETSVAFWIVYFGLGVFILYGLAKAWGHAGGSRYMTIGLRRAMSNRDSGAASTSHADEHGTGGSVKDYRRHRRSVAAEARGIHP
jgi:hypothetical protein